MAKTSDTNSAGKVAGHSARARSGGDIARPAAGSALEQRTFAEAKGTPATGPAAKASSRAAATTTKLSADRILGPAPGRRTVSDERIREAVRDAIRRNRDPLAE